MLYVSRCENKIKVVLQLRIKGLIEKYEKNMCILIVVLYKNIVCK